MRSGAPELIETVTVVLAPPANVPLVAESVSQLAVLLAVQFMDEPPLLLSVYVWLIGLNGPPAVPLDVNPEDELTESEAVLTVVGSLAVSLAVLPSPPPETVAVLVTLAAALPETLTVTVIGG